MAFEVTVASAAKAFSKFVLKLAQVDKRIQNIFVITKLSLVFDVYETEEKAIASFAEGKEATS